MKPEDFFKFNPETGEWSNINVDYRFVLIGETMIHSIVENLTEHFGSATDVFMYQSGLGVGISYGELLKNAPNKLEGLKNIFENIYMAGWGRMTIENSDIEPLETDEITIIEENGFFTKMGMKEELENLNPFTKGFLTGIFDAANGKEHTCEMEIVSEKPLKCRYIITIIH